MLRWIANGALGVALPVALDAALDPQAATRTFSLWLLVVLVGIAAFGIGHARGHRAAVRELHRFRLQLLRLAEGLRAAAALAVRNHGS